MIHPFKHSCIHRWKYLGTFQENKITEEYLKKNLESQMLGIYRNLHFLIACSMRLSHNLFTEIKNYKLKKSY